MSKPLPEVIRAVHRGAGNQAVTRTLGRAVLARMPTLSVWLGNKKLDKGSYRDYRIANKFTQTLNQAVADTGRPPGNIAALRFLQGEMDAALEKNDMDRLRVAVDGVANLLDHSDRTIDDVEGYVTKVVEEKNTSAEADEGEPAGAAPADDVRITAYKKSRADFCGSRKTPRLLSSTERDALMAAWGNQLTIGKLDPSTHKDQILKVKEGVILDDSHIRLDAEHVDRTNRYRLYRIQGLKTAAPVLAGVFIQLDTWFSNAVLQDAFRTALDLAPGFQYAVLYRGEYEPPQQS
jgi:hypothetical protein